MKPGTNLLPCRNRDCRNPYVVLVEEWSAYVEFAPDAYEIRDGVLTVTGQGHKDVTDPTGRIQARCVNCDTMWTLRRRVDFDQHNDTTDQVRTLYPGR